MSNKLYPYPKANEGTILKKNAAIFAALVDFSIDLNITTTTQPREPIIKLNKIMKFWAEDSVEKKKDKK